MVTEELAPIAPESLPKYLAEGMPKQDSATLKDTRDYIDELIDFQTRPIEDEDLPDEVEPVEADDSEGKGTVVKEKVTCGDDTCHCMTGDELHGPYLYRYFRDETGTVKSEYVGKP